jgi:hypothetical protein
MWLLVCLIVFNATFNNISVILWPSFFLLEKTGEPEKTTDLSRVTDKLYHIMLYTSPWSRFELTTSVVIGTDCIGSCKSNYHAITATTAPLMCLLKILYHGLNNLWWRQNNLLWKKSNILMSKGQRPRMVDIGLVKWHYFKMNAETCFTPKSFLVKIFF